MKKSTKILIPGIVLGVAMLFSGILWYCAYIQMLTLPYALSGIAERIIFAGDWGWWLFILSVICFLASGIGADVASRKEKRKQTLPSTPVQQQTPESYQPQPLQQPTPPVTQPVTQVLQIQYCSFCGKKLQPDWQICGYCGKKIIGA